MEKSNEIKRYGMAIEHIGCLGLASCYPVEQTMGYWVRADDFDAVMKMKDDEIARLEARCRELESAEARRAETARITWRILNETNSDYE